MLHIYANRTGRLTTIARHLSGSNETRIGSILLETFIGFLGSTMSENSDVITSLENVLQETENLASTKRKVDVISSIKALLPEVLFFDSYLANCLINDDFQLNN